MKKKIVTLLLIALVLVVTTACFTGCFFENLSFISGQMSDSNAQALEALNSELVTEDANGDLQFTLSNFTQLNRARGDVGEYSGTAVFLFKVTEKGFYISTYTEATGVASERQEFYYEKDGDIWFYYAKVQGEWRVGAVNATYLAMAMKQNATSNLLAETRKNIFSPKNYKSDGDHYKYAGPELVFSVDGDYKMVFDVEGLFTIEGGIEIKGQVVPAMTDEQKAAMEQAGMSLQNMGLDIPFSYSIYDVGSTTITFPTPVNADYKAQYKAAHQPQNGNNDNGNEDSGEEE